MKAAPIAVVGPKKVDPAVVVVSLVDSPPADLDPKQLVDLVKTEV
jgi:hypothetical protein